MSEVVRDPSRYDKPREVLSTPVDPVLAQSKGSERWRYIRDQLRCMVVASMALTGGFVAFGATAFAIQEVLGSFVQYPTLHSIDTYSCAGAAVATIAGLGGGYLSGIAATRLWR